MLWNNQLKRYINMPTAKYVVLKDGREIKRKEISDEEYEYLKDCGWIVREFER